MADFGPGGGVRSGSRASFGYRLLAAVIDGLLLGVVGLVLKLILGNLLGSTLQLVLGLGYYAYLEGGPSGQTVGKRAMGIRVVDIDGGGAIGPGRALIRYVGRLVSAIPCLAATVVVPAADYPVAAWPG